LEPDGDDARITVDKAKISAGLWIERDERAQFLYRRASSTGFNHEKRSTLLRSGPYAYMKTPRERIKMAVAFIDGHGLLADATA